MKGIQNRKELMDVWQAGGIAEGKRYAIFTNEIYKEWYGMTAKKYKPQGLEQNKEVAKTGGHAVKVARGDVKKNLGESIITKENRLGYQYTDEKQKEPNEQVATNTNYKVERTVKKSKEELGDTMSEKLPTPKKSIKELESEEIKNTILD